MDAPLSLLWLRRRSDRPFNKLCGCVYVAGKISGAPRLDAVHCVERGCPCCAGLFEFPAAGLHGAGGGTAWPRVNVVALRLRTLSWNCSAARAMSPESLSAHAVSWARIAWFRQHPYLIASISNFAAAVAPSARIMPASTLARARVVDVHAMSRAADNEAGPNVVSAAPKAPAGRPAR